MKTRILIGILAAILLSPQASAQSASPDPHMAKALELRATAESAYGAGDYDSSAELARQAKRELALIEGPTVLPFFYTVRLIPEDRDSLSKIAGYPFVYGDRAQWKLLYGANKERLKHPENADILLPGEVLVIPSIAGEIRGGAWEPGKEYKSID
jgi:nucleoid-associated protein YgaU